MEPPAPAGTRLAGWTIYPIIFVLAFCSIVYELMLGQSLSAFLGNTVLRYSVTIGLYMLSMGIGALIAEGRLTERPVLALQRTELALSIIGGLSVSALFVVDSFGFGPFAFSVFAHALIVVIGILTGFEIPLAIRCRSLVRAGRDHSVLGVDYIGAFVGTLTFAFILYGGLGLTQTAFAIGSLNAIVGVGLVSQMPLVPTGARRRSTQMLVLQTLIAVALAAGFFASDRIEGMLLQRYLSS